MQTLEPIVAKASGAEDQSDGIVVSFGAEWHQPLRDQRFKAVIRKRVPKTMKPAWLYFHVNAPVSAICARARVLGVREMKAEDARRRAADLALSAAEVAAYVGADATIGWYELGPVLFPRKEIGISEMSSRMVYFPPQSFFILSRAGKAMLDEMAGFESTTAKKGSKR